MSAPPEDAAPPAEPAPGRVPEETPAVVEVLPEPVPVTAEAVRLAEALLFASDRPVTPARLQGVLPEGQVAAAVLEALGRPPTARACPSVSAAGP